MAIGGVYIPTPIWSSAELELPVLKPLREIYNKIAGVSNKYELYRMFVEADPEVYGALNRIAMLVRKSYQGIGVHIGHELDDKERELLKSCEEFEKQFNLPSLFYSAAFHLIRDGDDIYLTRYQNGLTTLQPLPIHAMTIVTSKDDIQNVGSQVFRKNWYVLNEGYNEGVSDVRQKLYRATDIMHISLNNRAEVIYDTMSRFTFGVWSMSPLEPLRSQLLWKLTLRINDIILRQKLVPRLHHKLDLSAYDPTRYQADTMDARISAAKAAATREVTDYKTNVAVPTKAVDQDIITGKSTEIDYVEPKHVSYIDPNPLLAQINKSIFSSTGTNEAAVQGTGRGTYATELVVASYTSAAAEVIAEIVKEAVLKIVRNHMRLKYPDRGYTDDDLNKVDIKFKFMLGIQKSEAVRRAAVIGAMGIATATELRDEVGLTGELTEDERKEIIERVKGRGRTGDYTRTQQDIASHYIRRTDEKEPETPQSEQQKRETV